VIANHPHDHADHVTISQQLQQLPGAATVPYSFVGCCVVKKHSSNLLLSRKAILDVLCQQGDLVYSRPPVSKAHLLLWEQWVDDWFNISIDDRLDDCNWVTQQRSGIIALCGPRWFFLLRDRSY